VSDGPDVLEIIYRNPMHVSSFTQLLHQFFSYDELNFYKSCKIKLILAVRNPLDIILSNSNKINFGDPAPVISNLPWFESLSENIRNYYLRYMQILDEFFVMKYEDLMEDPSKEIGRLAGFLDMPLDAAAIHSLWQQWGNKKIGEGGGHFWQPGAGKWRRYFTADHLAILRKLGYESLLDEYGYDSSGLSDDMDIAELTEATPLPETSFLINDYHMQRFHGKKPVTNIGRFKADLFLLDRCSQSGHPYMRVYCSPGMRNTFLENEDFPVLCQVLASM
ncbi:MAG: sulfotransferase domain-containing protein, partial [Rhodospirillales bacterium]|nr:sulfotransferase domain-containing protein [Rhodospirillales bacterium]